MRCPCGKAISYEHCCGQYIDAQLLPLTPETLMRSRYTAFTLSKIEYLKNTMQGKATKIFKFDGLEMWLNQIRWQGLTIIKIKMKTDAHGFVTFAAHYLEQETSKVICEKSEFKKFKGKWFYVDGKTIQFRPG